MLDYRNSPIRRKLMTMLLVTSGVVLALTCATFVGYELFTYRETAVRQLATLAEIIAAESTGAVAFDNQRDATEILAALRAEHHIVAACLYDQKGRVFARYPADSRTEVFPTAPQPDGYRFEKNFLIGFAPLVQVAGSERLGTLFLMSDMEAMHERLRLYGGIALLVTLGVSIVAYLLARTMQQQISHPIVDLVHTARAVSDRRDYSVRATKHDDDELGVLTEAFNHMLGRIEEQNAFLEKRVSERTAELESANRELEAFCSSAAHDLRTPLRAITGFADVLLDSRAKIPAADAQRFLQLIRDGSGQMSDLIHALLSFSRLGRQPLAFQSVDLNELCREAYRDLGDESRDRKVELTIHPLPAAEGDPALLRLVWLNLLSNALKYTRTRPLAIIEIGADVSSEEDAHVYFVRDNGVGFDRQDAGKLFGVFQRLHHAHEFEGTGVGLATVRRIIDRHGGRIWAEAEPDRGATFSFTLKNSRGERFALRGSADAAKGP